MRTVFATTSVTVKAVVRARFAFIVCAAAVQLAGCTAHLSKQLMPLVAEQRPESLETWRDLRLEQRPFLESVSERTAVLAINAISVTLTSNNGTYTVDWQLAQGGGVAVATPITADGYFLTASHVVARASSLTLIGWFLNEAGEKVPRHVPARVVWQPPADLTARDGLSQADISVIHADVSTVAVFPFRREPPRIGEPIILAGYYAGPPDRGRFAAGAVRSVQTHSGAAGMPPFVLIRHDAPSLDGDSGGPLLDRRGDLMAISALGGWSTSPLNALAFLLGRPLELKQFEIENWAVMPAWEWLSQVIDDDRRARRISE